MRGGACHGAGTFHNAKIIKNLESQQFFAAIFNKKSSMVTLSEPYRPCNPYLLPGFLAPTTYGSR